MAGTIQSPGEEPKIKSTDAIYNLFLEQQRRLESKIQYNPLPDIPKIPVWPNSSKHQSPWDSPTKDILPKKTEKK